MGQALLPLLRPAYESTPELVAVASQIRTENGSSDTLRQQIEFDDQVARELLSLKLPDSQARTFENLLSQPGPDANSNFYEGDQSEMLKSDEKREKLLPDARPGEKDVEEEEDAEDSIGKARPRTILLAVGVGLVATISMVIFLISDRLNSFEGADRLSKLLESANTLTGDEFEAVETKAGDLQDWFFLKHGLEHYAVPKQFANIKTIGCRVFNFNGTPVAQIMAVTDKEILFYMFPSSDLGVKIGKGKWEIVEEEQWVGGVTRVSDTCFLVAFKGNKDEMKEFLSKVGR